MFKSKLKVGAALVVALGALGISIGIYQSRAVAAPADTQVAKAPAPPEKDKGDSKKEDTKEKNEINLPTGATPAQVLASLDKDGKLVIKTLTYKAVLLPGGGPNIVPPVAPAPGGPGVFPVPPGGAGGGVIGGGAVQIVPAIQSTTYDLDDVKVLDTKGKEIDKKDLPKLLKEETPALASLWGQPVDPLHLRLVKDGTLTFVLPPAKNVPGIGGIGVAPPGVPFPAPPPPAGGGTTPPGLPGTAPPGGTGSSSAPPR